MAAKSAATESPKASSTSGSGLVSTALTAVLAVLYLFAIIVLYLLSFAGAAAVSVLAAEFCIRVRHALLAPRNASSKRPTNANFRERFANSNGDAGVPLRLALFFSVLLNMGTMTYLWSRSENEQRLGGVGADYNATHIALAAALGVVLLDLAGLTFYVTGCMVVWAWRKITGGDGERKRDVAGGHDEQLEELMAPPAYEG